jgi:hypothetical protein
VGRDERRLGGAGGPLGWGLAPTVEGFYAIQHFEHGLMHWGRQERIGEPDYEIHIILYGPGDNWQVGQEWYRYTDYWQEGDEEYPCPQASPPWGPRRGFGKVCGVSANTAANTWARPWKRSGASREATRTSRAASCSGSPETAAFTSSSTKGTGALSRWSNQGEFKGR